MDNPRQTTQLPRQALLPIPRLLPPTPTTRAAAHPPAAVAKAVEARDVVAAGEGVAVEAGGEGSQPPSVGNPPLSDASSLVPISLAPYFLPTPPSNTVPTGCSWENHAAVPAALALDAIISMTRSLSPPIRTRLPTTSPPPKDYGLIAPASTPSPKNLTSSNSVARRDPVRTRLTRLRHLFFVQCNFPFSNEALSKLS